MTVDDNEVRAGNSAGQAGSAISLPAVAWQQAGDGPEEMPEERPQGGPEGKARREFRGEPAEGSAVRGPAPEIPAEREPSPTASAVPAGPAPAVPAADGETGSGTGSGTGRGGTGTGPGAGTDSGADDGTDTGGGSGTEAGTDTGGASGTGAGISAVSTAVANAGGDTGTGRGTPAATGAGTDSDGEEAPERAPGSGTRGTQAASDADGLAAEAAAAPVARPGSRPARRLSKPVIAAAATSGVVLMGVPLLLSQLGGGGSGTGPVPPRPTGYNQADGGPGGFVPRADAPQKGSPLPGAAAPGATAGPGKGSSAVGKGPLSTGVAGIGAGVGVGAGVPAAPTPSSSQGPGLVPAKPQVSAGTPRKPATQAPPAPPAKQQYSAVAGPNCAGTGASFTYSGWYTDGKEGWQKYGSGGYVGGGCNGGFFSLPMSGKAGSDAGNALRWTFRTGAVTSGTCQVSVHIPSNSDIKAVGGKPSYYTVHAGATGNDPILRSFTVDQPSLRGQWVSAGSVRVTGGVLTVKLHDRGLDWSGSQKTYAHHAGDAARVQCTSS
ncbi:hypothetical protein [Streptomyces sp. NPDC053431]|uniref:hypothetical protein n=1 Tax=Streptomyces sp. NPDC053431 TaxID=3365703 RepID=UPI0037D03A2E